MLLEKWMVDPVGCCEAMGLQAPLRFLGRNPALNDSGATLDISLEYLEVRCTKNVFF